jgi:flagellar P-ring protein precursor FlgI
MTPLVTDADAPAVATAQGAIIMSDGNVNSRDLATVETSGRIPSGGLLEGELAHTNFANTSHLILKEPDIATATRIVDAINKAIGANTAKVEDPGSIALALNNQTDRAATLVKIQDLKVTPDRPNRLIVDGRDGTVVAGGDISVSSAVVSHGGVTLTIGSAADAGSPARQGAQASGQVASAADAGYGTQAVRLQTGVSVQKIAAALQAVQISPSEIAAIFESLREVGALAAEVTVR